MTPENFSQSAISFKKQDVLKSALEQSERLQMLNTAMKLGNNHKQKVRLFFMNANDQLLEIQAKVWSVTEKYVILKNSITIPIVCICGVNLL